MLIMRASQSYKLHIFSEWGIGIFTREEGEAGIPDNFPAFIAILWLYIMGG